MKSGEAAPTGAPQRRGPGVDCYPSPGPRLFSADKHNESASRTRHRAGGQQHPLRGRSSRRRQSRSAAARSQDAAVYGWCSRPPAGTLMNLSKRQHLRAGAPAGHTPPQSSLEHLSRSSSLGRKGGPLLASRAGLTLDSASELESSRAKSCPCRDR
jgi:hypothetical protein